MGNYPTARVMFAFIATPSLAGVVLAFCALVQGFVIGKPIGWVTYFGLTMVLMMGGLMFYGIPALLAGLTCVLLRLQRSWRAAVLVMLVAAVLCQGWAELMASQMISGRVFLSLPGVDRFASAALGAIGGLLIVWRVLPRADSLKTPAGTATPPPGDAC